MKRVAVVEDTEDNRVLINALLDGMYVIDEYESGRTALDGMRATRPDLVLLDISMPDMDGLEVLRIMREDEMLRHLPVIALTAHAGPSDRDRFLQAGFTDYMSKPIVDFDIFYATLAKWIEASNGAEPRS